MLEPKYIKVLGSMTCKVQSMTLYVWEKSGYFTQQQQQQQQNDQGQMGPSLRAFWMV